jgi:NAD(P)-dependent dehydrogenase (short-subunit alcohol dehydrogenase family)
MASFSPRVLVTGGGYGLGYATVEFLLNKYNARVVVFTLEYGKELEALLQKYVGKDRLFVLKGDVTNVSTSHKCDVIWWLSFTQARKADGFANHR